MPEFVIYNGPRPSDRKPILKDGVFRKDATAIFADDLRHVPEAMRQRGWKVEDGQVFLAHEVGYTSEVYAFRAHQKQTTFEPLS